MKRDVGFFRRHKLTVFITLELLGLAAFVGALVLGRALCGVDVCVYNPSVGTPAVIVEYLSFGLFAGGLVWLIWALWADHR